MTEPRILKSETICSDCVSRRGGLCSGLPDGVRGKLAEGARVVDYPADRLLWDEESRPGFVAIVRKGFLRMVRYSVEGRRQIMAIVAPGELIGEGFETRSGYALETATPVRLCRMERGTFERLSEDEPSVGRAFYRQCVERLDSLRRVTWSLGLQSPEERFCGFLASARQTMPYQPVGKGGILRIEISRADIADYLGTTRETISRIAHKLQSAGLIEIRDPATFHIPDMERLEAVGASRGGWRKRSARTPVVADMAEGARIL
ncbi:MAG: Crp/Fnr family transcriptional regulator [Paracoccaceae bacterium]|nr:Crp/Fnr family transcriptional regulator [Paracoccaceae bacterium]